jgi:hypothetical protein
VYTDTSAVRRFDYIVEAVKRAGARKVLFGSDGPWLHPGLELHKIRLLKLPPEKEALILGGNALRLLRRARVGREVAARSASVKLPTPGAPNVNGKRYIVHAPDSRLPPDAHPEHEL